MSLAQSVPQAAKLLEARFRQLQLTVWAGIGGLTADQDMCVRPNGTGQHIASPWMNLCCRTSPSAFQPAANSLRRKLLQSYAAHTGHGICRARAFGSSHCPAAVQQQQTASYSSLPLPHLSPNLWSSNEQFPSHRSQQQSGLNQQPTSCARVLDGKAVAAEWSSELKQQVPPLTAALGRPPGLMVVLVGDRPDSLLYASRKEEACQHLGVHCRILRLPDTISQQQLQEAVGQAAADQSVDGVLVQLPLPHHLDEERVMESLDPRKDVDGFHPLNMGRMLMRGRARRFVPATPLGVVELLSRSAVSISGRTAVVLGDSNIVGTPLAALLRDEGAALVTTCHRVSYQQWYDQAASWTRRAQAEVCLPRLPGPAPAAEKARQHYDSTASNAHSNKGDTSSSRFQASQLPSICRTADILIVAVGSPELVKSDWVKPGAIVVDVGINVVLNAHIFWPGQHHQQQRQQQHQAGQPTSSESDSSTPCFQPHSSLQLAQGSVSDSQCSTNSRLGTPAGSLHSRSSSVGLCSGSYQVVGDVAHDEVAGVASVLTPVPGGVGPMTIAAVLHNTLQAARYTAGLLLW